MAFLKKDPIDPDLYLRVYQAGYDPQRQNSGAERLHGVGRRIPFRRVLRYWPIPGALIFGTAAGIGIATHYHLKAGLEAVSSGKTPAVSPPRVPVSESNVPASASLPDRTAVVDSALPGASTTAMPAMAGLRSAPLGPVTQPLSLGAVRTRAAVEKAPAGEPPARETRIPFQLPSGLQTKVSANTPAPKVLPVPPSINMNAVPQMPSWAALPSIKTAPPAMAPAPRVVSPTQRAETPTSLRVLDPQPLRKVMPAKVSLGVILYRDLDVQVRVTVGTDGRVTDVRPVPTAERVNQSLLSAALLAAQQWLFQPATLRGQAIASDCIIVFRFHAKQ